MQSPSPAVAHLLDVVYAVRAVYAAETDQVGKQIDGVWCLVC